MATNNPINISRAVSALPDAEVITGAEILMVVANGTNMRVRADVFAAGLAASGVTPADLELKADKTALEALETSVNNIDHSQFATKTQLTAADGVINTRIDDLANPATSVFATKTELATKVSNTTFNVTTNELATVSTNLSAMMQGTNNVIAVAGKTGVVSLVKADVGLGRVDNTNDMEKPVSTATQAAIDAIPIGTGGGITQNELDLSLSLKANIESPTLTGNPKAPTVPPGEDGDNSIATTEFSLRRSVSSTVVTATSLTLTLSRSDLDHAFIDIEGDLGSGGELSPPVKVIIPTGVAGKWIIRNMLESSAEMYIRDQATLGEETNISVDKGKSVAIYTNGEFGPRLYSEPELEQEGVTVDEMSTAIATYVTDAMADVDNDLSLKADINSPQFTGVPTVPTPALSPNSTVAVNAAYVKEAFSGIRVIPFGANGAVLTEEDACYRVIQLVDNELDTEFPVDYSPENDQNHATLVFPYGSSGHWVINATLNNIQLIKVVIANVDDSPKLATAFLETGFSGVFYSPGDGWMFSNTMETDGTVKINRIDTDKLVTSAPYDSRFYTQQDGIWVEVPVDDIPELSEGYYVRTTSGWERFNRYDLSTVATTGEMDLNQQQVFTIDATINRTLSFVNVPAADRAMTVVVNLTGGGGVVTWPVDITWADGTAPTIVTTLTVVGFYWTGVTWIGTVITNT